MHILVTGGAGYIGSITAEELEEKGFEVTVIDSLVNGHKEAVKGKLIVQDILDREALTRVFDEGRFDAVMHFAAFAQTSESMLHPYKYFHNNIEGSLTLLEVMREKGVNKIIYSSTCAIFGSPRSLPITESEETKPASVYGESKLAFEKILSWYHAIHNISFVNLRYFNACGASLNGTLGEMHDPETHIIPLALDAALGLREFKLFGTDYSTRDGTCVRDYIHVVDLARAHILALEKMENSPVQASYNLGSGVGFSNREVIAMVRKVTGREFTVTDAPRRPGDPPELYADNTKIQKELGFKLQYSDLETIVRSAWEWHQRYRKNG